MTTPAQSTPTLFRAPGYGLKRFICAVLGHKETTLVQHLVTGAPVTRVCVCRRCGARRVETIP